MVLPAAGLGRLLGLNFARFETAEQASPAHVPLAGGKSGGEGAEHEPNGLR